MKALAGVELEIQVHEATANLLTARTISCAVLDQDHVQPGLTLCAAPHQPHEHAPDQLYLQWVLK